MTGGITNGRSVTNSIRGRSWGRRSRTQKAVGTMIRMLKMIVRTPMIAENDRLAKNCGSANMLL